MAHAHAMKDNTGMIAGIAALSAGIGAIVALLVTPRTGEEMRGGIKRRTHSAMDTVSDKFGHVKEAGEDMVDTAKDSAKDIAETHKRAAKDMASTAKAKKDELK